MASLEPRKRRKKFHNGKPMEAGSCEPFIRSRKKQADIERLAHKYMQKCSVDSSTESESDVNTEVLSNRSLEKTNRTQLPFLDPYDGDYEEISGGSDCSLGSLDSSHRRAIFLRRHVTEGECHSTEPVNPFSAPTLPALPKSVTQEDGSAPFKTAITFQLNTEPSCFTGPPPSKEKGLFQGASLDGARPQLTSMECDEPIITRKHRRSVLESAGEKLKKRLRVA